METQTTRKGKTNGYSNMFLRQKRDHKRIDAEDRQRIHNKLSTADKLKKAQSRRGKSKREINRLIALLEAEKKTAKEKVPTPVRKKAITKKD